MRFIYAALVAAFLAFPAHAADPGNVWRLVTTHMLDFGTTAVNSTVAFGSQTRRARVICTVSCYFAFATSSAAYAQATVAAVDGSTSHFLPANVAENFIVSPGQIVVAIGVSSAGIIYVTELSR